MTDTARVLLTAAILSGVALTALAWRVSRLDPSGSDRLIGELRLTQWATIVFAAIAAIPLGLALSHTDLPLAHVDAAIAVLFVGAAGGILQRDPREGLLLLAVGFGVHALLDIAHRPEWLSPDMAPRWFVIGAATFDVYVAALCFWVRRQ